MKRLAFCMLAGLFVAIGLSSAMRAQAQSKDGQEIRGLEAKFAMAFAAKDVDAIMKFYVPGDELFVFDVGLPRQHVGWEDYRKDWKDFIALFPGPIKFDMQDLHIVSDGKIAYSHCIQHVAGTASDGTSMDMRVRVTDVYRKVDGKWLIVQEHVSVPIDFTGPKPVPDMMSKP
jgi:uncharacterized protein (TIGR02246 family)